MPSAPVQARGPGRVNLIGEHTDYNAGLALPFAIERGVTVTAEPSRDGEMHVNALDAGEEDSFALDATERAEGWRAFVRGTVAELRAAGHDLVPASLTIEGDVPQGSGLSSSAALESALCLALLGLAGVDEPDRRELAKLCSRVENDWVGAHTGLLDQIASLFGEEGHALRVDFLTLAIDPVPLELGDWRLVSADSGAEHEHADSGYNERREECRRACELLGIETLREVDDPAGLPEPLDRRVRHVLTENARVEAMVDALADGALRGGRAPARREPRQPARRLRGLGARGRGDGAAPEVRRAAGARMVGGGFGGHVLALFPPGAQPPADALEVRPGPAARLL